MESARRCMAKTYFSLFQYPLTCVEHVLWCSDAHHSFEAPPGLWGMREKRQTIAQKKWRKALRWGRVVAAMPYVRLVAVCNNLSYDNATQGSDLDIFIVTASGRIWTARFFVSLFLKLFGLRPHSGKTRDQLCASFFVSEDHLNLQSIALQEFSISNFRFPDNFKIPDVYLHYWTVTLYPIYDAGGVYRRFCEANGWIAKALPHASIVIPHPWRTIRPIAPWAKKLCEFFCRDWIEGLLKRFQTRAFPRAIRALMNKDTRVVVSDAILKFHTNDRRGEYRKRWAEKMKEI